MCILQHLHDSCIYFVDIDLIYGTCGQQTLQMTLLNSEVLTNGSNLDQPRRLVGKQTLNTTHSIHYTLNTLILTHFFLPDSQGALCLSGEDDRDPFQLADVPADAVLQNALKEATRCPSGCHRLNPGHVISPMLLKPSKNRATAHVKQRQLSQRTT